MRYYNYRNILGQFTRRVVSRVGKRANPNKIVSGRLYDFKGATVRALRKSPNSVLRPVSFHKTLFGFVKDTELQLIGRRKVQNYLEAA